MIKRLSQFAAAGVIYLLLAVYLYLPYFKGEPKLVCATVLNLSLASSGCFVLSRRWVGSFAGSLFSGAIYGFGPFVLGMTKFHPSAAFLAATIPWLFCPAAFGPRGGRQWLRLPLSALPFLAIVVFFQITAYLHFFPMPIHTTLQGSDLVGLLAPLVSAKRGLTLIGFYHVPIACLLMGLAMLVKARRLGTMAILLAGTILAFSGPFFEVAPVMWAAVPTLCCAVMIGAGMQALVCSGIADKKWTLAGASVMAALAIITLLLATKYFSVFAGLADGYARLFVQTAKLYILGTVAISILFFVTCAKLRIHWLRWVILGAALAIDIFLSASFVIGQIF